MTEHLHGRDWLTLQTGALFSPHPTFSPLPRVNKNIYQHTTETYVNGLKQNLFVSWTHIKEIKDKMYLHVLHKSRGMWYHRLFFLYVGSTFFSTSVLFSDRISFCHEKIATEISRGKEQKACPSLGCPNHIKINCISFIWFPNYLVIQFCGQGQRSSLSRMPLSGAGSGCPTQAHNLRLEELQFLRGKWGHFY